jgi:preprotein translocase subunit SecY
MMDKIIQIWKARDLRNSIIFVFLMLVIFRFLAQVPIPGVDAQSLKEFFNSNQVLGLINLFSGGAMENFSVVMLGVGPYITASIIFQLLGMIMPSLEEMQKEESGRQKINFWTRWITVPLSMIQGYGMLMILKKSSVSFLNNMSLMQTISVLFTVAAGTILLMWIGELISEKKIGNGTSLIIFAGIISGLPTMAQQLIVSYDSSMLFTIISIVVVAIITVVGVVIINEGQRNIPVQYARQIRGNRVFGGSASTLPLRVNMAGVMPIIFAVSVIMFPTMIAQFFIHAKSSFLVSASNFVINIFNNQLVYGVIYFLLVVGFTYFYTEVVFHPTRIAENLQKQGGFIPGIRPGRHTSEYLANTAHKIIFTGALFLGVIAILPLTIQYFSGLNSLTLGGTSLLIVVSVVIETAKQIQAQLTMREYEY